MRYILFIIVISSSLFGMNVRVRLENVIELSQSKEIIQFLSGIAVDKKRFYICDPRADNIKIFDKKGKLIKIFGRTGYGPDEFRMPVIHDYYNSILVIGNKGTYRTRLYKIENGNFLFLKEFRFRGINVKLSDENLLYCGIKARSPDGKRYYNLFSINLKTGKKDFLVPYEMQFGMSPDTIIVRPKKRNRKINESIIGYNTFCEMYKGDIFFCWTGILSIIKFDPKTRKIARFGKKTANYIKPRLTDEIKKGYRELNSKMLGDAKKIISWVSGLFCDEILFGVIYVNFDKSLSAWIPIVQFYNKKWQFINEVKLKKIRSLYKRIRFFYDRNSHKFYSVSHQLDNNLDDIYKVVIYKFIK